MPPVSLRLFRVWWTDTTNVAGGWHDPDEVREFATDKAWHCNNTGWLVFEDAECIVLAGRMTDDESQFGLLERIPKSVIVKQELVA